ncbi:MAG TPA: twin-arginine translocase TatA/TatE family subunit, partial [Candidatus Angelobacter sp.]
LRFKKDSKESPAFPKCIIIGCSSRMNFSFSEMAFLVLLGLVLFGPKKLPEIARTMGKFIAEFKRASNEFQSQIHDEIQKLELDEHAKAIEEHAKEISAETSKILPPADDPDSITAALNRLSDRIKNIPRDYDA